ncbi:MAG TPA: hypothetical protein VFG35_14775 [Actinoplanes sp.]|nr:hypothetical protein [Actinoplanes sp.]
MPDSLRLPARLRRSDSALTAASTSYTPTEWRSGQLFGYQPWQAEAWGFRRTLGEFNQAIDWQARAMSRIRLGAAEVIQGADEPEMLTEGPAADLMADFCGGPPGHSAFLRAITPHLAVPGEGWLIAERDSPFVPLAAADWGVYSTDCVQALGDRFRVRVGPALWRDLLPDNLPMRIYEPDPQWPWLATSSAEAAVPIMRRIFLIDCRIIAMMVSRLVMNGLMLIPQEGTFSVPTQYKDAPDPFVAMLIDIASRNIANPGNASAGIPIPVRFTADLIEKWRLMRQEDPLDEWLLKERLDELGRLGDTMGISRERVTGGMGEQNHWGAWQASEDEIKITFAPMAETICGAVTKAFLRPALIQAGLSPVGPRGGAILAWYDTTELAARPDRSGPAREAYDRFEISGTAYRRENGFDESDAPDDAELRVMILKKAATTVELAPVALAQLTGDDSVAGAVAPPAASGGSAPALPGDAPAPATGPPPTREVAPPPPGPDVPVAASANGHRPRVRLTTR